MVPFPSKTTTAYAVGEWLYSDGTNIIPATTTTKRLVGICQSLKAVGTSGTATLMMKVPRSPNASVIMDVGTSTIARTSAGIGYDLTSSTTVNASSSTYSPLILKRYISTTKGEFLPNWEMGVNA
ncbi:MAG: hypothetical protein WC332_02775 [Clostridia bacterium]